MLKMIENLLPHWTKGDTALDLQRQKYVIHEHVNGNGDSISDSSLIRILIVTIIVFLILWKPEYFRKGWHYFCFLQPKHKNDIPKPFQKPMKSYDGIHQHSLSKNKEMNSSFSKTSQINHKKTDKY